MGAAQLVLSSALQRHCKNAIKNQKSEDSQRKNIMQLSDTVR